MTLEEYENALRPRLLRWHSISEIPRFPFQTFAEVREGLISGRYSLGIDFTIANHIAGHAYGIYWALLTSLAAAFPFLLAMGFLVAALFTRNYWLLVGIPSALLGYFSANPYNRARAGCGLLAATLLALGLWFGVRGRGPLGLALAAFPLTFLINGLLYAINQARLRAWATASEVLFVGLFEENKLGLKDRTTGKQLWASDLG